MESIFGSGHRNWDILLVGEFGFGGVCGGSLLATVKRLGGRPSGNVW